MCSPKGIIAALATSFALRSTPCTFTRADTTKVFPSNPLSFYQLLTILCALKSGRMRLAFSAAVIVISVLNFWPMSRTTLRLSTSNQSVKDTTVQTVENFSKPKTPFKPTSPDSRDVVPTFDFPRAPIYFVNITKHYRQGLQNLRRKWTPKCWRMS